MVRCSEKVVRLVVSSVIDQMPGQIYLDRPTLINNTLCNVTWVEKVSWFGCKFDDRRLRGNGTFKSLNLAMDRSGIGLKLDVRENDEEESEEALRLAGP